MSGNHCRDGCWTSSGNLPSRLAAMLVAASNVAHAPRPRSTTDHRRNRARSSSVATPSRSAPPTAAIAAVPLKQEPHCPAFSRSKYASTDAATATGQSSVSTAIAPLPRPLPRPRSVSWSSVASSTDAIEQAGEVAAHQRTLHLIGRNTVQGKQFGERQPVRNLVEAGRSAGTGERDQEAAGRLRRAQRAERRLSRGVAGRAGWPASPRCSPTWGARRHHSWKGRGGLSVGLTGPPLIARTAAVSSPAMYPGSTVHTSTAMPPRASGPSSAKAASTLGADSGSDM